MKNVAAEFWTKSYGLTGIGGFWGKCCLFFLLFCYLVLVKIFGALSHFHLLQYCILTLSHEAFVDMATNSHALDDLLLTRLVSSIISMEPKEEEATSGLWI